MNENYSPALHRSSIRLKGYDYSQSGMYFVTICCRDMVCRFGNIENGEMILNDFGKIAYNEWEKLPERYPNMILDVFQIMPNHVHGVVVLGETSAVSVTGVGATLAVALNNDAVAHNNGNGSFGRNNGNGAFVRNNGNGSGGGIGAGASPAPTMLGMETTPMVRGFKSSVTKQLGFPVWQRNYWENIIRNEKSYQYITNYIINNPAKWENDKSDAE